VQDKKFNEINDLRIGCAVGFAAMQQAYVAKAAFYFCA
jgi:hypothetical protein